MEKQSKDQTSIQSHLYNLLIPSEILLSFVIDSVLEKEEDLFIYLTEKKSCIPSKNGNLIQNGFMNPVELNSFPVVGKRCYLVLKRRKWKQRGSNNSTSYTNTYNFTLEGTKATKDFGDFLKENSL